MYTQPGLYVNYVRKISRFTYFFVHFTFDPSISVDFTLLRIIYLSNTVIVAFHNSNKILIGKRLKTRKKKIVKLAIVTPPKLLQRTTIFRTIFRPPSKRSHYKPVAVRNLLPRSCIPPHIPNLYTTVNSLAGVKTFISSCVCCCRIATYNRTYTVRATHDTSLWVYLHRIDVLETHTTQRVRYTVNTVHNMALLGIVWKYLAISTRYFPFYIERMSHTPIFTINDNPCEFILVYKIDIEIFVFVHYYMCFWTSI